MPKPKEVPSGKAKAPKPFGPATRAPNPGTIRKTRDTITRYEDRTAVRNKGAGTPTPNPRAVAAVNKNPVAAARSRVTNPTKAPGKGGIDLPKFAGEVGRNLDRMIPSRGASTTVSRAMKPGSNRLAGYNKGNPVAEFLRQFVKIGK